MCHDLPCRGTAGNKLVELNRYETIAMVRLHAARRVLHCPCFSQLLHRAQRCLPCPCPSFRSPSPITNLLAPWPCQALQTIACSPGEDDHSVTACFNFL